MSDRQSDSRQFKQDLDAYLTRSDEPNDEWVCMDCENGVSPCAYCGYCTRHCECTYEVAP